MSSVYCGGPLHAAAAGGVGEGWLVADVVK